MECDPRMTVYMTENYKKGNRLDKGLWKSYLPQGGYS